MTRDEMLKNSKEWYGTARAITVKLANGQDFVTVFDSSSEKSIDMALIQVNFFRAKK